MKKEKNDLYEINPHFRAIFMFIWLLVSSFLALKFVVFLSWSLADKLSEENRWKKEYQYCADCSNFNQCKVSNEMISELEEDLCSISEYNGHYRKTIYEK